MATKKKLVAGLDVGTSKVCTVTGTRLENGDIDIVGSGLSPCNGLRRGMVVDIEETISAISASLENVERMIGIPIERVIVGIGGAHINSSNSRGVIAVSRADGEISEEDIARVIEAARAVSLPANREILHVVPRVYTVDGQEGIKDPLGMNGIRLEVDAHVISGSTPCIKNLTKCVYQAGLDIDEIVFSTLATAQILLSKQQQDGSILIDMGAGTTSIVVFEEGDVLHSAVLPVGSSHITNDIAIGLRTSLEVAEKIKIKYGSADPDAIDESEEIDLSKLDKNEDQQASRSYIAQIIEARLTEIFILIKDELKSINREGSLPAGAILTGGGSKIPQITKVAKDTLHLPAQLGKPQIPATGLIDKLEDPQYSCGLGLMYWGIARPVSEPAGPQKAASRLKSWFKQFLP